MASDNEARIWGVLAASGSGKGLWIKSTLRQLKPDRLIVYDYKDEYSEFAPGPLLDSTEAVRLRMLAAKGGPLALRFRSKTGTSDKQRMAEFQTLCTLVQKFKNCTFLAEELSNVTMPGWAPPAWREMTTGGRHEGVHIIGVAQNPALIDKTFTSNCTLLHVGPLREFNHRRAMARSMDIPVEKLNALQQFHWIERNNDTRTVTEGTTYPPGFVPKATPESVAEPGQVAPTRRTRQRSATAKSRGKPKS